MCNQNVSENELLAVPTHVAAQERICCFELKLIFLPMSLNRLHALMTKTLRLQISCDKFHQH